MSKTVGVALYGTNGHQVPRQLAAHPGARFVAHAACDPGKLKGAGVALEGAREAESLEALLADPEVDLVSLCSPRRADQAAQAMACLRAGKHVYAEKPCALTEEDLDALIAASRETGREFHEMAGTALVQPYVAMRAVIESGELGEVVQVFAQKSYPWHDGRPQDEAVDGGLVAQAAVHAFRMIEFVAGRRIESVGALETCLGDPARGGGLRMASQCMLSLDNGGLATVIANYLNPRGFGRWSNEHLRVWGERGFVEAVDGGARTRLVVGEEDRGELDRSAPDRDYFDLLIDHLAGQGDMPYALEEELHPTRMVLRAKASALRVA